MACKQEVHACCWSACFSFEPALLGPAHRGKSNANAYGLAVASGKKRAFEGSTLAAECPVNDAFRKCKLASSDVAVRIFCHHTHQF